MSFFWEFEKDERAPEGAPKKESYHFQVNLGGMLDMLSNHLYKSPDVFLRELLQNGVDAITLRQKEQPGWTAGRITITLEPGRRMEFRDNGAGLTEEGMLCTPYGPARQFRLVGQAVGQGGQGVGGPPNTA